MVTQLNMHGGRIYPSYEEILEEYSTELHNYIEPEGKNTFGFWMQTLADLQLLDVELEGLAEKYSINPVKRNVELSGDLEHIRERVSHLEKVDGKKTLYTDFIDEFGDTNAYAFHNLYPYKGKFYPRIVRTLVNAFKLNENFLVLDPFNGSGTTTHECSLMGIKSVGVDITPMGTMMAKLKNDLLFTNEDTLDFSLDAIIEIVKDIENKNWEHKNKMIDDLMLLIYFDTKDAFVRTSSYDKMGSLGLFNKKYGYIKSCYYKTMKIKEKHNLKFEKADLIEGDVLELKKHDDFKEKFDAVITSPPYYFSIDYVGKDSIAYEYLSKDMRTIKDRYIGIKNNIPGKYNPTKLPTKVLQYYEDLKKSIENIYWSLKPTGKLAIIVGDSTVAGKKIPTTTMTKKFCEETGFKFKKLIFNPLLGARNRAIRGESIIICTKP